MNDNTEIQDNVAEVQNPEPAANPAVKPAVRRWWPAAAGAVLALAAWIALSFNGYAALAIGVAAFAFSCFGLRAGTRAWRNVATTALIASTVILVVLAAFLVVIFWGLNSI